MTKTEREKEARRAQYARFKQLLETDVAAGVRARPDWLPDHLFYMAVARASEKTIAPAVDSEPVWPLDAPQPPTPEEQFRERLRTREPFTFAEVPEGLSMDEAKRIATEMAPFPQPDNVNSPAHYKTGGIECFDAMRAMLSDEEMIGYLRGNSFKYRWRFRHKGGAEDLRKAEWYERKLIEIVDNSA